MIDALPIAHRVWAERVRTSAGKAGGASEPPRRSRGSPTGVLVFDTETTTDHTQRLNFGAWRYYQLGPSGPMLIDDGLFYADELPVRDDVCLTLPRKSGRK